VVEWQTRKLEVLVGASPWGFKSPLAHHRCEGCGPRPIPDGARFAPAAAAAPSVPGAGTPAGVASDVVWFLALALAAMVAVGLTVLARSRRR
jgi:hypothetical protein